MRRIQQEPQSNTLSIYPTAVALARETKSFRGALHSESDIFISNSKCISCFNTPCIQAELGSRLVEVCPVKAITIEPKTRKILISEDCISCGLCALRCPVGAIEWSDGKPVKVNEGFDESVMLKVDQNGQTDWLLDLKLKSGGSPESIRQVAAKITNNLKREKASVFYPLVASYFRILGFQASASNMGDTSSRADVTISTKFGTVPIEVKSFTEVEFINLKSIQQALENKLFTARQDQESELSGLSSLALAFSYPSDRTRLEELIEDIDGAFGIRIGIISLPRLIEQAIALACGINSFDPEEITRLKGLF